MIRSRRAPSADPNPQLQSGRSSGTLIVAADAGSAGAEFDRCEAAADLTCFRAANVVLRFEEMAAADRARVSGAVVRCASRTDQSEGPQVVARRTARRRPLAAALPDRG